MAFGKKKVEAAEDTRSIFEKFLPAKEIPPIRGLIVGVFGDTNVGKTHFTHTCDMNRFIIDTEGVSRTVLDSFGENMLDNTHIFSVSPINPETAMVDYDYALGEFESALRDIYAYAVEHRDEKWTIVIDSMSNVWEWLNHWLTQQTNIMRNKLGKPVQFEYQHANLRHASIIQLLEDTGYNVIMTGKAKAKYSANGQPTSELEGKWQMDIPYHCHVCGELVKAGSSRKLRVTKFLFSDTNNMVLDSPTWESIVGLVAEKRKISTV